MGGGGLENSMVGRMGSLKMAGWGGLENGRGWGWEGEEGLKMAG